MRRPGNRSAKPRATASELSLDPLSTKLTTAGTVLTPKNVNSGSPQLSKAYINTGTITTVIMSAQGWLVAAGEVTGAIPVAQDQYTFTFGEPSYSSNHIGTQTLVKFLTVPVCPIIVAPGYFLTLEMFGASNGAAPAWTDRVSKPNVLSLMELSTMSGPKCPLPCGQHGNRLWISQDGIKSLPSR